MVSTISSILLIPTLILASLPLLPLALLTTAFALAALALRASLSYLELASALFKQFVSPDPPAALSVADYSLKSSLKPRPLYSFSASGSVTPRRPSTGTSYSYSGPGYHQQAYAASYSNLYTGSGTTGNSSNAPSVERDFEGMGGWREAGEGQDDEDRQWTGINSRLELPAAGMRTRTGSYVSLHNSIMSPGAGSERLPSSGSGSGKSTGSGRHRRSWTSGAVKFGLGRKGKWWTHGKDAVEDGGSSGAVRPNSSGRRSGTISPEDSGLIMMAGGRTKSLADIGFGMNVGRSRAGSERRKSGGSSGSLSSGSGELVPTMTGTGS